jgi:hypothetical protein
MSSHWFGFKMRIGKKAIDCEDDYHQVGPVKLHLDLFRAARNVYYYAHDQLD